MGIYSQEAGWSFHEWQITKMNKPGVRGFSMGLLLKADQDE
jgi:hypothetical protein